MENLSIRQYRSSDIEQCRNLWKELTEHHRTIYNDPTIGGRSPEYYFDEHLKNVGHERIWVAEYDNKVVGIAGLIVKDNEGEIDPVVVSSKHRGKGIGKAIVEFVIKEARKLNLKYLSVKPVLRNIDAIAFYHHIGFRGIGQIELFMELTPNLDKWVDGIELYGCLFKY